MKRILEVSISRTNQFDRELEILSEEQLLTLRDFWRAVKSTNFLPNLQINEINGTLEIAGYMEMPVIDYLGIFQHFRYVK